MGAERYVVDAVILEGRSRREVARSAGISKGWVDKLVERYRAGGYEALQPRSRRPRSCAHATSADMQAAIIQPCHELAAAGHDHGAHTIAHHLRQHHGDVPSDATIWRVLQRHGLITPQPQKRPKSSFIRFEAQLPNELWQADTTHWRLADGSDVEVLNCLDDHSRLLLVCDAFRTVKAADVVHSFANAWLANGYPAALLTDKGAVFSGKSRKGKVLLESELERLGIVCKHSTPYHPQTCGKVERFHQTLKRYLSRQTTAPSLAAVQLQLDTFRAYYNHQRPHRALDGASPLAAFSARLKARPGEPLSITDFRVRQDRTDTNGTVTPRYLSRLRHIALGRAHKHEPVTMLIAGCHVRVVAGDGSLIRELTIDPARSYQGLGTPCGRPRLAHHDVRQAATMS
ncbi:MAG: IS481 family transposase [Candidatus Dormibacteraeota bacterium]|nr:IS481 family transposase [Candidatus Dormibacteraeota bacterium]